MVIIATTEEMEEMRKNQEAESIKLMEVQKKIEKLKLLDKILKTCELKEIALEDFLDGLGKTKRTDLYGMFCGIMTFDKKKPSDALLDVCYEIESGELLEYINSLE